TVYILGCFFHEEGSIRMAVRKSPLRAVKPDERQAAVPKSIEEAALAGSQLDELRLTRARIARTLDDPNCPPRDLASLAKRLMELGREVDSIEAKARQEAAEDVDATPDEQWDSEAI